MLLGTKTTWENMNKFGFSKSTPAANEPAADNAGSRGKGGWLELLNMETKIEDMTCYCPHMRLPAGRYAQGFENLAT